MIERLTAADRDDIVDVLVAAFWDYPVMRFVLGDTGLSYADQIRALVGFYVDRRLLRRGYVFGIRTDSNLAAVTLVDPPEEGRDSVTDSSPEIRLRETIGDNAWGRMTDFEASAESLEPDEIHYFIGMIGVDPQHQGHGLSRQLIDEVVRMSRDDPASQSVCLSTEAQDNLPFYSKLGFEITGQLDVGELRTWALARPTR